MRRRPCNRSRAHTCDVRHILSNIAPVYVIIISGTLGGVNLAEASLSYLGLGVPPPIPSWEPMLAGGVVQYAMAARFLMLAPGIALTVLVLGFAVFGDTLRDIWGPKLRGAQPSINKLRQGTP